MNLDYARQNAARRPINPMRSHEMRDLIAGCEAELAILDEYEARDKNVDLMLGPNVQRQREWSGLHLAVRLLPAATAIARAGLSTGAPNPQLPQRWGM